MQIVRTILWTLVIVVVSAFVVMNWGEPRDVRFWPGLEGGGLLFEWPVGFIALFFFLLGFVPMWLLQRGTRWRLSRRIINLENAVRSAAVTAPAAVPGPPLESEPDLALESSDKTQPAA